MSKLFKTPINIDVATGIAPLTVASTTVSTNLNADLLDGQHGSYYEKTINKNIANGYAGLDANGLILLSQLPLNNIDPSWILQNANYRFVTDTQISAWDATAAASQQTGSFVLGFNYPSNDMQTVSLAMDIPVNLVHVRIFCNTAPNSTTTIALYKNNTSNLIKSISFTAATTFYDISPDYALNTGDVVFAKFLGSPNNIQVGAIQCTVIKQ